MLTHGLGAGRHLRLGEESDADELHALVAANRERLRPWMPWADQDRAATAAHLRAARESWAEGTALETLIVQDDTIVGAVGLNRVDHAHAAANVGYWIAAPAQGRGTVTLGAGALIEWALTGPWQLHRIELRAGVENLRSRAVAERLGFTLEGVCRECERVGDRWLDHAVYGLLAGEWTRGRPRRRVW